MTALEWSQYYPHYKSMGIFPDAQGQLTHKSLIRTSNPSKMLWWSSLPARMKKNQSKMKALEGSHGFPHFNPWELSVATETIVLIRSGPKPNAANPPPHPIPMILQMIFDYNWPAGLRDIYVWKCKRTDESKDGQMPARVPSYKLIPTLAS